MLVNVKRKNGQPDHNIKFIYYCRIAVVRNSTWDGVWALKLTAGFLNFKRYNLLMHTSTYKARSKLPDNRDSLSADIVVL